MSYIVCKKCGETEIYLQYRGMQVGAYCSNCGSWQKWIGKKDLPAYQRKGLRIHSDGQPVSLKRDAPLGVIIEKVQANPTTFKSNMGVEDVLDDVEQEWENEYAQRVQTESTNSRKTLDLSDEVEIERRVKARLIIERESLEEELEKRIEERLKNHKPSSTQEYQDYCSLCDGTPLTPVQDKDEVCLIDVSIYDGVLTVTNSDGTKFLGVYKIRRCPECGREYSKIGV